MIEKVIIAGSGGQGVLTLGVLLAQIGVHENKKVTWLPSYGAEKMGGVSFCEVIISDEDIYSPVIEKPDTLFVFDQRAYDMYEERVQDDTLVVANTSLVTTIERKKGRIINIDASEIAKKLKFLRAMNIVMAGAYISSKKIFDVNNAKNVIKNILRNKSEEIIEKNMSAFEQGIEKAKASGS